MQPPRHRPVLPVGADERGDGDGAAVGEEGGDFRDAPDVLLAVGGREAEVAVQPEADVVAIEAVSGERVGGRDE